jgi:hypothetical protein
MLTRERRKRKIRAGQAPGAALRGEAVSTRVGPLVCMGGQARRAETCTM